MIKKFTMKQGYELSMGAMSIAVKSPGIKWEYFKSFQQIWEKIWQFL